MNGEYAWWFLVVGLVIGGALVWLVRGQMARDEEDVAATEREPEARWISRTIERAGGVAPADLVAQVLALHHDYLRHAEPFGPADGTPTDAAAPADDATADDATADDAEPAAGGAGGAQPAHAPRADEPGSSHAADDPGDSRLIWLERAAPTPDDLTADGAGDGGGTKAGDRARTTGTRLERGQRAER